MHKSMMWYRISNLLNLVLRRRRLSWRKSWSDQVWIQTWKRRRWRLTCILPYTSICNCHQYINYTLPCVLRHWTFHHRFCKCGQIVIILPPQDSQGNFLHYVHYWRLFLCLSLSFCLLLTVTKGCQLVWVLPFWQPTNWHFVLDNTIQYDKTYNAHKVSTCNTRIWGMILMLLLLILANKTFIHSLHLEWITTYPGQHTNCFSLYLLCCHCSSCLYLRPTFQFAVSQVSESSYYCWTHSITANFALLYQLRHSARWARQPISLIISSLWESHLRTTGCHTILLAVRHKRAHPTLTPASKDGTRFTYPGGMEGWVDLGALTTPRPGIEPSTAWSKVLLPSCKWVSEWLSISKVEYFYSTALRPPWSAGRLIHGNTTGALLPASVTDWWQSTSRSQ